MAVLIGSEFEFDFFMIIMCLFVFFSSFIQDDGVFVLFFCSFLPPVHSVRPHKQWGHCFSRF